MRENQVIGCKRYFNPSRNQMASLKLFTCVICKKQFYIKEKFVLKYPNNMPTTCSTGCTKKNQQRKHDVHMGSLHKKREHMAKGRANENSRNAEWRLGFNKVEAELNERVKTWYFGPGDIFHDTIVAPILAERNQRGPAS